MTKFKCYNNSICAPRYIEYPRGPTGSSGPQGPTGPQEPSIEYGYNFIVKSCVQISSGYSVGSGVFIRGSEISPNGKYTDLYILTCRHVIDENEEQIPYTEDVIINYINARGDLRTGIARIIGYSIRQDIAVLKFIEGQEPENPDTIQSVKLFKVDLTTNNFKTGESVMAIGNPIGEDEYSVSSGIIRESYFSRYKLPYSEIIPCSFTTDIAINPGNSGGGIFLVNQGFQVAGLLSWSFNYTENYNGAIHPLMLQTILPIIYENIQNIDVNVPGYIPYSYQCSWINLSFFYPTIDFMGALYSIDTHYIQPNVSTRGAIYYEQYISEPPFTTNMNIFSLIREVSYPNISYTIGAGNPFIPFDFLYVLIPPNTNVNITYRQPVPWLVDSIEEQTFIPMPASFNKYLVYSPASEISNVKYDLSKINMKYSKNKYVSISDMKKHLLI